jgi:predicted RNase H-like HicB family nuclease
MKKHHSFTAVIEKDLKTDLYVAYVPGLPGAHTQAATMEELQTNLQEVLELVLGGKRLKKSESQFVGTQTVNI